MIINLRPRRRAYVGIERGVGDRIVFMSSFPPTEGSHPHLMSVVGPFRTFKAAKLAMLFGPHTGPTGPTTVMEWERFAARWDGQTILCEAARA